MEAKEKGKELINKFYQLRAYETMSLSGKQAAWGISKESAIIVVEEILNTNALMEDADAPQLWTKNYWQNVLIEIDYL